ncbi:phospholipase A [Geopsychrobacter electrodiphilus]|uniref:phospholipase A n=1 Tax=Geopsychrobacter electrodiphilus TaxID=225196 RepID=UPI0003794EEA|nr:phospholipase A [Geopsychrobacter electrodiphilus]
MRICLLLWMLALMMTPLSAGAETSISATDAELSATPSELSNPADLRIDERRQTDKKLAQHPLSLVSHKPNYLIGSYYLSKPQTAPFEAQFPGNDITIEPLELKFQLSLKTLLISNLLGQTGDLWVGYTNRSFWQAFNSKRSSPFRETNHEPEAWFDFATDRTLGDLRFKGLNLGMVHQSNGQWGAVSRSWNRIYSLFMFQRKSLYFAFKPWWRIPESRVDDDNPDIEKYLGNFEFYALKEWKDQTLGIMLRNNLRLNQDNHGAVQLDYTFSLHNQLRGYIQWFYGYGESLIDYNHEVNTLGIGLMLSNWL